MCFILPPPGGSNQIFPHLSFRLHHQQRPLTSGVSKSAMFAKATGSSSLIGRSPTTMLFVVTQPINTAVTPPLPPPALSEPQCWKQYCAHLLSAHTAATSRGFSADVGSASRRCRAPRLSFPPRRRAAAPQQAPTKNSNMVESPTSRNKRLMRPAIPVCPPAAPQTRRVTDDEFA